MKIFSRKIHLQTEDKFITLANDKIRVLKLHSTRADFSTAVFVNETFAEDDFKTFLLKVLRNEDERHPFQSQKEIFDWLQEQWLCYKKLLKFLFDDGYIDEDGKIALQKF